MYLVFICMPGDSYCRRLRSLLLVYLWWSLRTLYLHACQVIVTVDVPLVEFMYLVFTRMPGDSDCGRTSGGVYLPCIYTHAR